MRRKTLIDRRNNTTLWDLVPSQQEAYQRLMRASLNTYINFLRIPFSFYQLEANVVEAAAQQARQLTEQATQQASEAATEQVRRLTEQVTQQATATATQQVRQLTEHAIRQASEAATDQVKQLAEQAAQEATEAVTQQVKQLAQHSVQQATEAATEQVKQLAGQAAQEATEAATEQVKQLAKHAAQQATRAATEQVKQLAGNATQRATEAAGTAIQHQREQARVWSREHPLKDVESDRPVLVRVNGPGMVHAGINQDGKWIRTYDVPLDEVSTGVWEAYLLDPEINEFTFVWYDPENPGKVHSEGKNHRLPRQEKGA
jgi:hypothetical protein